MTGTHARFFRGFLAHPLAIGAPVPSGRALAATIAAQIPQGGRVLELGAGTGAVTEALLARGVAPADLTAVEAQPSFASLLRQRFPQSRILEGNAFAFERLIAPGARFDAIVCGLPVIGRSIAERCTLLRMALAHLVPHGPFVQFSYAPWPPYPRLACVDVEHAATAWRNLPPMHIWVHRTFE